MHSQLGLKEHASLNLAPFILLDPVVRVYHFRAIFLDFICTANPMRSRPFLPERCKPPRSPPPPHPVPTFMGTNSRPRGRGRTLPLCRPRKFGRLRPEGGVGRSRSRPIRKAQEWKGGRERTPRTPRTRTDERQERGRWSKWCSNYFVSPLFQICTFGASFVICGMAACRHTCFRQVGTAC